MKIKHIKFVALLVALVLGISCVPALADNDTDDSSYGVMYYTVSQDALASDYTGNVTNLINVRNPSAGTVNTTTKSFAISAIAKSGVTITVYAFNNTTNLYEKVYDENNQLMQTVVGASNLYAQTLMLKQGSNKFMLVASKDGLVQTAKFEVTLLKASFKDKLKYLTIGLVDMFS